MPLHSKKQKKKLSVGVELRAGGDHHRSEKPGWSASDKRQWPKQKNAQVSGFSHGNFAVRFFQLVQSQQNDYFNYDLTKVSKMTIFNYDLSKVSKMTILIMTCSKQRQQCKIERPRRLFKGLICNFQMSRICKKRVHGNDKNNLPRAFKKCPGSLYFTLLNLKKVVAIYKTNKLVLSKKQVFLKTQRKYLIQKVAFITN